MSSIVTDRGLVHYETIGRGRPVIMLHGWLESWDHWLKTILLSIRTSGKAVVFTGLTMVLPILSWLFLSDFKFQAQMGMFLSMILTTNVILALTLHPLLIYLVRPAFMTRRNSE